VTDQTPPAPDAPATQQPQPQPQPQPAPTEPVLPRPDPTLIGTEYKGLTDAQIERRTIEK
jgi:hypothetical protein